MREKIIESQLKLKKSNEEFSVGHEFRESSTERDVRSVRSKITGTFDESAYLSTPAPSRLPEKSKNRKYKVRLNQI